MSARISRRILRSCLILLAALASVGRPEIILADPIKSQPVSPHSEAKRSQSKSLMEENRLVSIVAIIANPMAFHKRDVEFVAYLNLEFEGDALYLSPSDANLGITANAIWLNDPAPCALAEVNLKYVYVRGEFIANKGPRGLFAGTLNRPSFCVPWPGKSPTKDSQEMKQ